MESALGCDSLYANNPALFKIYFGVLGLVYSSIEGHISVNSLAGLPDPNYLVTVNTQ